MDEPAVRVFAEGACTVGIFSGGIVFLNGYHVAVDCGDPGDMPILAGSVRICVLPCDGADSRCIIYGNADALGGIAPGTSVAKVDPSIPIVEWYPMDVVEPPSDERSALAFIIIPGVYAGRLPPVRVVVRSPSAERRGCKEY